MLEARVQVSRGPRATATGTGQYRSAYAPAPAAGLVDRHHLTHPNSQRSWSHPDLFCTVISAKQGQARAIARGAWVGVLSTRQTPANNPCRDRTDRRQSSLDVRPRPFVLRVFALALRFSFLLCVLSCVVFALSLPVCLSLSLLVFPRSPSSPRVLHPRSRGVLLVCSSGAGATFSPLVRAHSGSAAAL